VTDQATNSTPGPLIQAVAAVAVLGTGKVLTQNVALLENQLRGKDASQIPAVLQRFSLTADTFSGVIALKELVGQINVVIHTIGILTSLPHLLDPNEIVENLSLGAGTGGHRYDLETNKRIAEFKFIRWRGANSVRQDGLFADLFGLASAKTTKRRVLYVVGAQRPLAFLKGRRALTNVLKHHGRFSNFKALHGDQFATVGDYYASVANRVEILDLLDLVPWMREFPEWSGI
jgi:hypothetical protein